MNRELFRRIDSTRAAGASRSVMVTGLLVLFACDHPRGAELSAPAGPLFAAVTSTFTTLFPPDPLPEGVAANGSARVQIEEEPGIRERLKLDVEDVEVIGDPADPAFCNGFYEAVLVRDGVEQPLPGFPGIVVVCEVEGDPQGPTAGERNFDQDLARGDAPINPRGALMQIWEVEPVRDAVTGEAVPGPNGEPFVIESRTVVALEGVLN